MTGPPVRTNAVLADRGYDANSLIDALREAEVEIVIPAKKSGLEPRSIDENLYKDRNKVERYFNKLNRTDFYDLNKCGHILFVIISVFPNAGENTQY